MQKKPQPKVYNFGCIGDWGLGPHFLRINPLLRFKDGDSFRAHEFWKKQLELEDAVRKGLETPF